MPPLGTLRQMMVMRLLLVAATLTVFGGRVRVVMLKKRHDLSFASNGVPASNFIPFTKHFSVTNLYNMCTIYKIHQSMMASITKATSWQLQSMTKRPIVLWLMMSLWWMLMLLYRLLMMWMALVRVVFHPIMAMMTTTT